MSVLIGIVSKNRALILPKAIQSALDQTYFDKKIAVFDDASTDNTRALKLQFQNIDWHFASEPKGYLYARNKFMSEATQKYFCSLDDDAWFVQKDELELAIQYLEQHQDVAAVAFDILSPEKANIKSRSTPVETNTFIGCGHVVRLSAVKEAGYYEPNPGFYGGEEKDLCIKLMDMGVKIVKMPGVHVWHDKTTIARDLPKQHRSGVCNDMVFTYRRTPGLYLLPSMILKPLSHLKFSITFSKGILLRSGLLGLLDFYVLLFTFRLQRKPVSIKAFDTYRFLSKK